jgi:glycosyltransferase involved in cell wall biosynthesis
MLGSPGPHAGTERKAVAQTQKERGVAFLLDYSPTTWCSRDVQHMALCRALQERGIRPVLVYSGIASVARDIFVAAGISLEVVNYRQGKLRYFRKMRGIFRKYNVDTVDIEFFLYFDLVQWMAWLNGVRNIVFTESNSGVLNATSWKRALLRLRAVLAVAPAKRLVAISSFIQRQMRDLGMADSKITVVHKGVNADGFRPEGNARAMLVEEYGIGPDEIVLGTVAFLRPFKHPEILLEAARLLSIQGLSFRLFMVGDGPMKPELMALAERLGIAKQVHWLGHLASPENVVRGWDVFLLASVGEAFGFVLVEAMACGVPVVASKSGGIPEIVEHGRTGFLVPPLDPGGDGRLNSITGGQSSSAP